jgi:glycerate kinase
MRVLVAFDKFKDALTAPQACAAAAAALRGRFPGCIVDECPLADGGEGFSSILTAAAGGERLAVRVMGPRGETVEGTFGLAETARIPAAALARLGEVGQRPADFARIGLVEMAEASGLQMVPRDQRNPWRTTSVGTGELIRAAVQAGAEAVLLGVGGSATHDLGLGALAALGLRLKDLAGAAVFPPFPQAWPRVVAVTGTTALPPLFLACDVSNPLLGERGAAAVYGPQKGLAAADLPRLEAETERLARLLLAWAGAPDSALREAGSGAAGGIGFGLRVGARARLVPGADLIGDWLDVTRRIAAADLVITGEGRFDRSSAEGKGPGSLAVLAASLGKPVWILAGQVDVPPESRRAGWELKAITPDGMPLAEALRTAEMNLRRAVETASLAR